MTKPLRAEDMHPALAEALENAGWNSRRSMDVRDVVAELVDDGFTPNSFAIGALKALLGLRIEPLNTSGPNFQNTEPLLVDPLGVGKRHRLEAVEVEKVVGETVFPFGWWLSYSYVYMTSSGKVVAFSSGLVWLLGETPEQGLDLAVRAQVPLTCIGAREGQRPWPSAEVPPL